MCAVTLTKLFAPIDDKFVYIIGHIFFLSFLRIKNLMYKNYKGYCTQDTRQCNNDYTYHVCIVCMGIAIVSCKYSGMLMIKYYYNPYSL